MRLGIVLAASLALAPFAAPASAFEINEVVKGLFGTGEADDTAATGRKITWEDLAPELSPEARGAAAELNARIDSMSDDEIQSAIDLINAEGGAIVEELDGQTVSIEGYLVPLDFESTEAKAFVLVPYVGACIHVPPPPPNQIIFVKYDDGIEMEVLERNLWTPFRISGDLRAASAVTNLAEVGYQLKATDITVMEF
jgi:hypothetical protein